MFTANGFSYENELVNVLINNFNCFLKTKSRKVVVINELRIGSGIADIVAVTINERRLEERIANAPYPISADTEICVLAQLNGKLFSVEELTCIIGLNAKRTKKIIHTLCDKKLIKKSGTKYTCYAHAKPLYNRCVSVEAKLSNWSYAIDQAFRNYLFSTESYVALDIAHSNSANKSIQEFIKYNVGFLVVDKNKDRVSNILKPAQHKPISLYFSQLASENILSQLIS